ncbi:hypothetical protein E2C01_038204 [Portunus trituberculatus]|uniref:Uncharacterized protein n=1 Tax=Portunus trituberculatus TaxID=210409 RepID=A0A5B7FA90_PORTR|nr:hypothetical protein [Portunus trituberculatus]
METCITFPRARTFMEEREGVEEIVCFPLERRMAADEDTVPGHCSSLLSPHLFVGAPRPDPIPTASLLPGSRRASHSLLMDTRFFPVNRPHAIVPRRSFRRVISTRMLHYGASSEPKEGRKTVPSPLGDGSDLYDWDYG